MCNNVSTDLDPLASFYSFVFPYPPDVLKSRGGLEGTGWISVENLHTAFQISILIKTHIVLSPCNLRAMTPPDKKMLCCIFDVFFDIIQ